jgi:hypothetical protein
MNGYLLIDVLGWTGVASLLIAYGLVSYKKLEGDSTAYQLLNLLGSALLIMNSLYYGAYPSVGVNIAWIGIAILTLIQIRRKSNKPTEFNEPLEPN